MTAEISVIITSYNVANYISRAVESALKQEGINLEIILVDDASTDTTWAEIEKHSDPRITKLRLEKNSGPSAARNAAIARASGEWLAVLDGDDQFLPGRLKRMLDLAKANKADIVIDNLLVMSELNGDEHPMFTVNQLPSPLTAAHFIRGNSNFLTGYGLGYVKPFFRAAFLNERQLSYRESIRIGEDYILLLEALANGAKCVCDATVGYGYTIRANSISHRLTQADVARIEAEDEALFARCNFTLKEKLHQRERLRGLREAYAYNRIIDALKRRDWATAFTVLWHYPLTARHLWLPLAGSLKRARATGSKNQSPA